MSDDELHDIMEKIYAVISSDTSGPTLFFGSEGERDAYLESWIEAYKHKEEAIDV